MLGSIVGLVLIDKLNQKNKKLFILNIYSTMKKAVLLSLLFFLIYACKSENNVCKYLEKDGVCIKIINKSGEKIKHLSVKYEGGKKEIFNLNNNEEAFISINSPGEGSYMLVAVFENGEIVKSKETYVEAGYEMTEIIHLKKIETKTNMFESVYR